MEMKAVARRRWVVVGIVIGCWLVCALFFTPQIYLFNANRHGGYSWGRALSWNLVNFGIWAVLTPLVLRVGHALPIERSGWGRNVSLHLALSCAFSLLHIVISLGVWVPIEIAGRPGPGGASPGPGANSHWGTLLVGSFRGMLIGVGATNVLIYWAVLAVSQALSYFGKYQEREYRLAQAQLQSLRTQLHPHFFFNTLNAISELVHTGPEAADRTLTGLSDLLRLALQNDQAQEVPLRVEVEFLRKYIAIQQMLLGERLTVEWDIEAAVLEACVPTMILQPLVENAIRHGIAPRTAPGHLRITAGLVTSPLTSTRSQSTRPGDGLRLVVWDNGLGLPAGWDEKSAGGIGLLNTRERLRHLYGAEQRLELGASPQGNQGGQGGVAVTITMPFQMAVQRPVQTVPEEKAREDERRRA